MRSSRGETFRLDDLYGVTVPFGTALAYPHICKIIDFKEKDFFGLNRKIITITLHKEI
jgi:hypothetical protein